MLKPWGRMLVKELHRCLYGCRKFFYMVRLRKKLCCGRLRVSWGLVWPRFENLWWSPVLYLPPPWKLCPDRKCNLQHCFSFCHCDPPWEVCLHHPFESGKQQATPHSAFPSSSWVIPVPSSSPHTPFMSQLFQWSAGLSPVCQYLSYRAPFVLPI